MQAALLLEVMPLDGLEVWGGKLEVKVPVTKDRPDGLAWGFAFGIGYGSVGEEDYEVSLMLIRVDSTLGYRWKLGNSAFLRTKLGLMLYLSSFSVGYESTDNFDIGIISGLDVVFDGILLGVDTLFMGSEEVVLRAGVSF